jgi:hypothetical protein
MATCFMCDQPATTKEHVPPKCFFPEYKDLKKDHRRNLITVKACKDHNLGTSKDDEYLLVVICAHWLNNSIGDDQARAKVLRALKNSPGLYRRFFGPGKTGRLIIDNELFHTAPVDRERFESSMEKIARGIYFHHFRQKWTGSVLIDSSHLYPLLDSSTPDELVQTLSMMQRTIGQLRQVMLDEPKYGANPGVFYYQMGPDMNRQPSDTIIRMVFYEGFDVFSFMRMNSSESPD